MNAPGPRRGMVAVALLAGLGLGFVPATAGGTGVVAGRVTGPSGEPMPWANVMLEGTPLGAAVDSAGNYLMTDVPAGSYRIQFLYLGYETVRDSVVVADGDTARVDARFTVSLPSLMCDPIPVQKPSGAWAGPARTGFPARGDSIAADPAAVEGILDFALNLYSALAREPGNVAFSPVSVALVLDLCRAGAAGGTRAQIDAALPAGRPATGAGGAGLRDPALGFLPPYLRELDAVEPLELAGAAAFWSDEDLPLDPGYVRSLDVVYGVAPWVAPLTRDPEAARERINAWIAVETRGTLPELFPPESLRNTAAVLTSAIYFRGDWETPFPERDTRAERFRIGTDPRSRTAFDIQVPTMHLRGAFAHAGRPDLQVLELPYAGNAASLFILLPHSEDGLPDLEAMLADSLGTWLRGLDAERVEVALPRFSFVTDRSLVEPLRTLGIVDAFDSAAADFTGMTPKKIWIDDVIHGCYLDVAEWGTEAAAATGVTMTWGMSSDPAVEFRADHPFLFVLRENRTGLPLFLGRVVNPEE